MIKFNDDNIAVGQIKQLLHSFNLPQCRVYNEKDNYELGDHYIKGHNIYVVRRKRDDNGNLIKENGKYVLEEVPTQLYNFGDKVSNLTYTLDLRNNIYDSYTHKFLGDYLRFLRDYTGLDLMSMYNCCGWEAPLNLDVEITREIAYSKSSITDDTIVLDSYSAINEPIINLSNYANITNGAIELIDPDDPESLKVEIKREFKTKDNSYTLLMIPVHFGKVYTIALELPSTVEMFCGFYSDTGYLTSPLYKEGELENETYFMHNSNRFSTPFIFDKLENLKSDLQQEENLKLFIKVPVTFNSSLVVLEGNYLDNAKVRLPSEIGKPMTVSTVRVAKEALRDDSSIPYNTKLQLLKIDTKERVMLADRLLEYLTEQVVTPIDDISTNIKKLQLGLNNYITGYEDADKTKPIYGYRGLYKYYGIWDDNMRKALYDIVISTHNKSAKDDCTDLLYYLDKDVEDLLKVSLPTNIHDVEWINKNGSKED